MKYVYMIMFFEKYTDINRILETRVRINQILSSRTKLRVLILAIPIGLLSSRAKSRDLAFDAR